MSPEGDLPDEPEGGGGGLTASGELKSQFFCDLKMRKK